MSGSAKSPEPNGPPLNPDYNTVFERLRELASGDDISSSIAYSLYKESKREWIKEIKSDLGRSPNEEELSVYSKTQTKIALAAYLSAANQILATYAESVIEDAKPHIQRDAVKGRFRSAVGSSVVGSFVFALFLLLIGLIAAYSGYGFPIQVSIPARP